MRLEFFKRRTVFFQRYPRKSGKYNVFKHWIFLTFSAFFDGTLEKTKNVQAAVLTGISREMRDFCQEAVLAADPAFFLVPDQCVWKFLNLWVVALGKSQRLGVFSWPCKN